MQISPITPPCPPNTHHPGLFSCVPCARPPPSTVILSLACFFFPSSHLHRPPFLPPLFSSSSTPKVSIRSLHVSPVTLSIHPSVHPCMHGWTCVRSSACAIVRNRSGTEPSHYSRDARSSGPLSLFIEGRSCETAHNCTSSPFSLRRAHGELVSQAKHRSIKEKNVFIPEVLPKKKNKGESDFN